MSLRGALETPESKRQYVRTLFATIADRYDLITVVLSYGRDRAWKKRLVREAEVGLGQRVLDLACGTGDVAFEARRRGAHVVGLDITERMVEIARRKAGAASGVAGTQFLVGDMMALPFEAGRFDRVTTGYGLRNVPRLEPAIAEIARVLKPGGRLVSLDFNRPSWLPVRALYLAYLEAVGGALGWALHRDPDTYRYIPASIRRYPGAAGIATLLSRAGFTRVRVIRVLGGLMAIHVADRG